MFNFAKKKKDKQNSAPFDESAIDASHMTGTEEEPSNDEEVFTELSLHPDWKLQEEDTYVYRFYNNDLPPLKPNQISLSGFDLKQDGNDIIIDAFVRNSLSRGIRMKRSVILLLDKQGNRIARRSFDLSEVGNLPGKSSRPWRFTFKKGDFITTDTSVPVNGWSLAFELKRKNKHSLDLEQSWEQSMASEEIDKLRNFVNQTPPPKHGEVNFLGLQAKPSDGSLQVTMLIRNGSEKDITLQNLPLRAEDATGQVIAEGGFRLKDLTVKANTSKPWTFVFPKDMIKEEDIDLSKWKVYPIQ